MKELYMRQLERLRAEFDNRCEGNNNQKKKNNNLGSSLSPTDIRMHASTGRRDDISSNFQKLGERPRRLSDESPIHVDSPVEICHVYTGRVLLRV
jgi:hypothetical protein